MKSASIVPHSNHSVEGHVPSEAHDDHDDENRARDREKSPSFCYLQALENRPNLQTDKDERQNVHYEYDGLPHGVSRDTDSCGSSLR